MALYEYECKNCRIIEVQQKISDEPLKKCPHCEEPIVRLISVPSPPQFKGYGFYATDYKKKN